MTQRLLLVLSFLLLSGCSVSSFGKYQAQKGIPTFLQVGKTTRAQVLQELGEPLVHRLVAGQETLIYNHEKGRFFFLWGDYQGTELVIRLNQDLVSEVREEATGYGWGFFAPATANNPGTRRSAR